MSFHEECLVRAELIWDAMLQHRFLEDTDCHCRSEREALALLRVLDRRFAECGLVLHPEKTKVVYCKDTNRKGEYSNCQFDFLGYRFRPRRAKWRGELYGLSFLPAASPKALKAIRQAIRGWSLQTRSDKALDDLARMSDSCQRCTASRNSISTPRSLLTMQRTGPPPS